MRFGVVRPGMVRYGKEINKTILAMNVLPSTIIRGKTLKQPFSSFAFQNINIMRSGKVRYGKVG